MACKSGRFRKRFGYFLGLDIEYHADEVLALFHHVKYLQLPDIYDIFDIQSWD